MEFHTNKKKTLNTPFIVSFLSFSSKYMTIKINRRGRPFSKISVQICKPFGFKLSHIAGKDHELFINTPTCNPFIRQKFTIMKQN